MGGLEMGGDVGFECLCCLLEWGWRVMVNGYSA